MERDRVLRMSEAAAALGEDAPMSLVQSQVEALRGGKSVAEYSAAFRQRRRRRARGAVR